MERSTGITLSAVAAILGSSLLVLTAAGDFLLRWAVRGQTGIPSMLGPAFLSLGFCMIAFSAWGLATAAGLLQLQAWSRISMLVFSAFLIALCAIGVIERGAGTALFLAPLALFGAGWLYFFSAGRTKAQFRPSNTNRDASTRPLLIVSITAELLSLAAVVYSVNAFRAVPRVDKPDPKAEWLIGRPAPDFRLRNLNGTEVQLSALKGKVVLLDFWATWCAPCREEMPKLERLSHEFKDKNVAIFGINVSEPEDTIRKFIKRNKYTYPVLVTGDHDPVIDAYSIHAFPTMVAIDRNGMVEDYSLGTSRESEDRLRGAFNHMLRSDYIAPRPAISAKVAVTREPTTAALPEAKTPEAFVSRGWARLHQKRYTDAISDASLALKLKPNWEAGVHLRANAGYYAKDYASAIKDYSTLLKKHPGWAEMYARRGRAYSYSGRHDIAIADYNRAIALDPYVAGFHSNRGWAYRELGQLKRARADLDRRV